MHLYWKKHNWINLTTLLHKQIKCMGLDETENSFVHKNKGLYA